MKMELLRVCASTSRCAARSARAPAPLIESAATGNLKPWREVVTPHEDVASGRYQQAEFAADLWQVHWARARTSTGTRSSSSAAPTSPRA